MDIFEQAQKLLALNKVERNRKENPQNASLLKHILWCTHCKTRMTPTYSSKKNIKYRYYVCHKASSNGYDCCPTKAVNAHAIETAFIDKLHWIIVNTPELKDKNLAVNTAMWEVLFPQEQRRIVNLLVKSAEYEANSKKLTIELNTTGMNVLQKELA